MKTERRQVIYTSELGAIRMEIHSYNHPNKNRISKLFFLLSRYRILQNLYDLKRHHIDVGYDTSVIT